MAFLAPAMAAWTKPRTLQQQQQYERSLDAESSLQPPAASTRRWDVLMIAVDDMRSELSCSGPEGFDTHAIHTPHLCDLAHDSLMLLRSQVRPRTRNHASRPHASASRLNAVTLSGDHGDLRAFACVDTHQSAPVDHPCL